MLGLFTFRFCFRFVHQPHHDPADEIDQGGKDYRAPTVLDRVECQTAGLCTVESYALAVSSLMNWIGHDPAL